MNTVSQEDCRKAVLNGRLISHLRKNGYAIRKDADYRMMCMAWTGMNDDDLESAGLTAENRYGRRDSL